MKDASPPRDPERDHEPELVEARRAWTGHPLPHVGGAPVPTSEARGNVEGMIGFVQVPVGIAAPLLLRGDHAGSHTVPFATTEGTLVASYQRGFKLCAAAGGIDVRILRDGLRVWPTLSFPSVAAAIDAGRWVDAHQAELRAAAEATTSHGRVTSLSWEILGHRLVLELGMDTGDAHGINMVTRAAGALVRLIPDKGQVLLHGYDAEKRASTRHWRGKWAVAECVLPRELVLAGLKVPAAAIAELWATYQLAYARMGTANHGIQIANGLAAIYLATGQDVAYVAESAVGTLSLEDRGGDLHATLDLPNLHAATVGGGTRKGTAAECQALLGVRSARQMAAVIAGALLAGDLNLAGSFLGDDFVGAHERLGRNRSLPPERT